MRRLCLLCAVGLAACAPPVPPAAPTPRHALEVNASFGKTWDSVIDVFAERNIPIRTMDRTSGFIAAEPTRVGARNPQVPHELADCGRDIMRAYLQPSSAIYNILVRGDSSKATVKTTVRFVTAGSSGSGLVAATEPVECTTRGVWEEETEQAIKARAERSASQ